MALKIRLARAGARNRPFFRIVVADSRSPRDGRYVERLGFYDPLVPRGRPERLKFDTDRVRHWLGVGATPTDRVARFLADSGLVPKPEIPKQTKAHLPRAKARERAKAAEGAPAPAQPAAAAAQPAPAQPAAAAAQPAPAEEA